MIEFFKNPLIYILLVNIFTLVWAVRSWKKNIREKWMNSLRDAGAELIGAAELVYSEASRNGVNLKPETMSSFIAKEQKLLLLFAHNEAEKKIFEGKAEALRKSAESTDTKQYRSELDQFSKSVNDRVLKEWNAIK
ncbi:hypothetical protein [Shewanella algae]|uniref:hypothetical protein n=1 Tax=Shewanella algae TaxID=38313 RepID=UPI001AACCE0A|nr:hypothetical protein [Shewanella algae]QTE83268.1 hypothetical protein JKK46_05020 [Shewanella algae]